MKTSVLLFLLVISCASPGPEEVKIPLPANLTEWKTPQLILPDGADEDMKSAAKVFQAYANSDEFYFYVRQTVKKLEGGNENDLEAAITKYRSCLGSHEPISVVYWNYGGENRTRVIGAWRNSRLIQNRFQELNAIDRAAHWVHEITHACGFTHFENDIVLHPEIKRSWSYQVGNAFKDFIEKKAI